MIYIAHRGNLEGPNPEKENHPDYIKAALDKGFDVEIDVWNIDGKWLLGHDGPEHEVNVSFLTNIGLWHHCKNIQALYYVNYFRPKNSYNCFFHDTDDAVLTSNGYLWTYPGKELTSDSIAVMPERVPDWDISKACGICTDFPIKYKADFDK